MSVKWVADSSWLFAFLSANDLHHAKAYDQMGEAAPVLIPASILAETLDLIRRRHGKATAVASWRMLASLPHLHVPPQERMKDALAIWQRHAPLTLADAVAVAEASHAGVQLRSFDDDQLAALEKERVASAE